MYKAIIFDLDNTLGCYGEAQKQVGLNQLLKEFGITSLSFWKLYDSYEPEVYAKFLDGQLSKEEYRIERFLLPLQEMSSNLSLEQAVRLNQVYMLECNQRFHYYNDAPAALIALKEKETPIYLLTNGSAAVQRQKIETMDLDIICDKVFISEEIGYAKPDIRCFDYAQREIQVAKQAILMVGDSMLDDYFGAEDYGMGAVWLNRGQKSMRGVTEIRSLAEVAGFF